MASTNQNTEPNLIYSGQCVTIRSISNKHGEYSLKQALDALTGKLAARRDAAYKVVDASISTGRSGGRLDKLRGSRLGLLEFKLTRPGVSPPHLRVFILREGNTLWAVHMIVKKTPRIEQADVDAADSFAQRWLSERSADRSDRARGSPGV